MSEQGGSERGIRAQLNRIVLIPSITFLALFAVLSTVTLTQAVSLRVATGDGRTGVYLYYSIVELQRERRLAVQYASAPSQEVLSALRQQAGTTDGAVEEVDSRGAGLRDHGDGGTARAAAAYFTEVDRRSEIRDGVMSDETGPRSALSAYDEVIAKGIRLYDALVHDLDDGPAAAAGADAAALVRAQESFTRGDALLSGAIAADRLTTARQTGFASMITGLRTRMAGTAPSLDGQAEQAHSGMVESAAWRRMNDTADTVAAYEPAIEVDPVTGGGSADRSAPESLDGWRADADDVNAHLVALVDSQLRAVTAATDAASAWMFNLALGGGIVSLFAGTVAYGVASRSAARLTSRLGRLRADTLILARDELPRIVRRLADAEPVDLDTELRRLDHGNDEVGQVADAFNTAQRTAVSAAVKEAETRAGVNRVFLAIAHRNQSLVQRQLQLLDRIEREEEDPDLLEDLFHLDHLATRGRRNAENLIILGGGRPGRRWRNPIPLVDILRGAISETDEYTRVKLRLVPELSLSGSVVADVIHLVAELVENATAFSPPHTVVHIHSEVVPKGVAVEIEDRGLGMGGPDLDAANATLEQAPEFDVMALNRDSRLGLFVVARLAAKHDIHVRLCPSPYGGTRAVVLIPAALISRAEPSALPDRPATAPGPDGNARTSGGLLAGTAGRRRKEVPAESAPAAPAAPGRRAEPEPADHAPAPSSADPQDSGGERPALPRRRRQANLAPQLRHDPAPAGGGGESDSGAPVSLREPDDARRMMSAFQSGTRQGREESDDGDRERAPVGEQPEPAERGRFEHGAAPEGAGPRRLAGPEDETGGGPRPPTPVGAAGERAAGRPSGPHTGESE
ncbi:sensor histidine kinase [Streptomonospora litoralis]|uniref:histidine kinase n=1 Tax=Streptomonospora litoralis TaxID=2498135 RepID=A0A4P6Q859_9ACTN|nr:nitrate- and nitrite sensing domain-containing protein [Streptomonospora litoralis]QBI55077.1 Nitrate and nitrite sensing [Streptomonospora litoralis]